MSIQDLATHAAALDSTVVGVNVRAKIFEDPILTELYTRGTEDPEILTDIEKTRYSLMMHIHYMGCLEHIFSGPSISRIVSL